MLWIMYYSTLMYVILFVLLVGRHPGPRRWPEDPEAEGRGLSNQQKHQELLKHKHTNLINKPNTWCYTQNTHVQIQHITNKLNIRNSYAQTKLMNKCNLEYIYIYIYIWTSPSCSRDGGSSTYSTLPYYCYIML